jgi:hypothetical protein
MKIVTTIALVFGVIIASAVCLMSSTCAVSREVTPGLRAASALLALFSLAGAIGGVMLIGKLNKRT